VLRKDDSEWVKKWMGCKTLVVVVVVVESINLTNVAALCRRERQAVNFSYYAKINCKLSVNNLLD